MLGNLEQKSLFKKIIFIIVINLFNTAILAKTTNNSAHTNVRIVVTIKPLYNLAAALMQGINSSNKPILLLQGNVSPHDYSLKFSDVRHLEQADLIVWGGEQLEFFLIKLLKQQQFSNKLFTVQNLPGLNKLNFRNKQYLDEHLWLSPENAKIIVKALEKILITLDPKNAKKYAANRRKFLIKLASVDSHIKSKLKFVTNKTYLVFHDAYQYFEKFYGLQSPIVISDHPAIPLSIQRMLVINDLIVKNQVHCIFKEPQFTSKSLDSLLKSNDLNGQLKVGILDPLGSDQDLGAEGYFRLINNLAEEFYSCFAHYPPRDMEGSKGRGES